MIDKFLALMTFVLFYSFTNHYALRCRTISKEAGTLQFHCSAGYSFEKCERLFVESRNVTNVIILECEVNKFPTELFGPYQNLKRLEIHSPTLHNLSQDNFIGANQLEDLSITGGEFNISASIFVNAPKLKAFSIHYTDVTFIDPQAFNSASALKTLILTIQSNATWPEGLFDSLTNLQVLDLHRNQYSDLYDNEIDINNLRIPVGNTIKLFKFVAAGDVVELKAETFVNLTQLTMLLFGSNSIERIRPYTFVRMNQLILLDLRGNKIQELTQTMLAGLINLRTADFAFNDIRYIESGAFSSTPQLRRLDLSYNEITTLEPQTLNSLLKISHLDLSRIYIKDEPCTVDLSLFCNQPNLSYLNLGYKGISKLKKCTQSGINGPLDSTLEETLLNTTAELLPEWQYLESKEYIWDKIVDWAYVDGLDHIREFSGLLNERQNTSAGSRLTILNLSWNGLSDWEDNLFDTLANLRILDLERNPIESLRPAQFNGLGNLLILRLNSCQLTSLDFNAFSSLTNLKKLYLVHNRIQTITPPGRPMYQLTYLELSENGLNSTSLDLDAFRQSFDLNKLLVALGSRFK